MNILSSKIYMQIDIFCITICYMEFFDRVKNLVRLRGTTIEYIVGRADMSLSSYNTLRRRNTAPRADEALKIAAELGTTVEYLLTGKEASSINIHDIRLFGIARKWQSTLEDLETLSPELATQLSLTIHVAAGQGKMLIEETGTER